jgi:hypothetical protein
MKKTAIEETIRNDESIRYTHEAVSLVSIIVVTNKLSTVM